MGVVHRSMRAAGYTATAALLLVAAVWASEVTILSDESTASLAAEMMKKAEADTHLDDMAKDLLDDDKAGLKLSVQMRKQEKQLASLTKHPGKTASHLKKHAPSTQHSAAKKNPQGAAKQQRKQAAKKSQAAAKQQTKKSVRKPKLVKKPKKMTPAPSAQHSATKKKGAAKQQRKQAVKKPHVAAKQQNKQAAKKPNKKAVKKHNKTWHFHLKKTNRPVLKKVVPRKQQTKKAVKKPNKKAVKKPKLVKKHKKTWHFHLKRATKQAKAPVLKKAPSIKAAIQRLKKAEAGVSRAEAKKLQHIEKGMSKLKENARGSAQKQPAKETKAAKEQTATKKQAPH